MVATSLTFGNFLKINSDSSHTSEVQHTSIPLYNSHIEILDKKSMRASPWWVVKQPRGINVMMKLNN